MNLTLDNARIRELIPGVIHEVEGEDSLFDKLKPFIGSAKDWLETNILGDYTPEGSVYNLAEKIIVNKAFARAIPSLDLVMSPAGFAVISTEGRAPASKERIERLIASLNSFVDANVRVLVSELHNTDWQGSHIANWFRSTFLPTLKYVQTGSPDIDIMDAYRSMRDIASRFEVKLGNRYLGRSFMAFVRSCFPDFSIDGSAEIHGMISSAVRKYISSHQNSGIQRYTDTQEIWQLARPIMAELNYYPELKELWLAEMGDALQPEPFVNKSKGGFFF